MSASPRPLLVLAALGVSIALAACTPPVEPERTASTPAAAATAPVATTPVATATATATVTPAASTPTAAASAAGGTSVIIPPSPDGTRYDYVCAEGKTFSILAYPAAQERVTLMIEGKTLELKQERSGSGTRHSDGNYTLVAKGVDAFIEQGGTQTYRDCKASHP